VRHLGNAVLLDSGFPKCKRGRFDIISAAPIATISSTKGHLQGKNLPFSLTDINDPFTALSLLQENAISKLSEQAHTFETSSDSTFQSPPFCGGLLGHFSYDLGRCIETLPEIAVDDINLPEMQLGLYTWAIIIDHQLSQCYLMGSELISNDEFDKLKALLATQTACNDTSAFSLTADFVSNVDQAYYNKALEKINNYILSGDCYQVNFAQRFSAPCKGDPLDAYQALRDAAPTHFSAFIDTDDGAILSLSPERFLSVDTDGQVITQPIKGTQPRSVDPIVDQANIDYLHHSEKDKSENLMIVDLMRNDISKSCALHSVKVPALFAVESYRNVHHLVSTVTGKLELNATPIDLLRNCFPGGSITGAPKIRAMEIIDELEPHRRSIYCGSIGYLSLCGRMDTSITIRTLLVENDTIHCCAGGGIVADSVISAEYQETFDKVNNLLNALREKI
jgi:para-aminobenzoate synthetase component 1